MNYFISGGAKNGKSMFAQKIAKNMADEKGVPLYYLATMDPVDDEDRRRIRRHIEERDGWGFITLEQPRDICNCLNQVDRRGVFLLDSVTALLSNEMFLPDGSINERAGEKVAEECSRFAQLTGNTVFVSDYIYSEARIFDEYTEMYRKGLALADRTIAGTAGAVVEVAYGTVTYHKGGPNE